MKHRGDTSSKNIHDFMPIVVASQCNDWLGAICVFTIEVEDALV